MTERRPHEPLIVRGAGHLVSGRTDEPRLDGNALLCKKGRIVSIAHEHDIELNEPHSVLDVGGATVAPGLIDAHVHPVVGDYTPRQQASGWLESYLHGGVTTLVSAGEPHWPGRDHTAASAKAIASAAFLSAEHLPRTGARLHAGALLLEPGLCERDLIDLASIGVRLLGEIGIGAIQGLEEVQPYVELARKHGFLVPVHVGGASIPGSAVIGAAEVLQWQPDVACHVNGGPTAPSMPDVEAIIAGSACAIEVVQAGNVRALVDVVATVREAGAVTRLQVGSDTPSGTGVIPLSVLRVLAYMAGLAGLEPSLAIAAATGNTARRYGLEGGVLEVGRAADLTILDAPVGSQADDALDALRGGDVPAVSAVVTDGEVRFLRSRMTPPPKRPARLETRSDRTTGVRRD